MSEAKFKELYKIIDCYLDCWPMGSGLTAKIAMYKNIPYICRHDIQTSKSSSAGGLAQFAKTSKEIISYGLCRSDDEYIRLALSIAKKELNYQILKNQKNTLTM